MNQLIANAQIVRARLRYPPNAVRDAGIDLKRLPRGFSFVGERVIEPPRVIKIASLQETRIVPVVHISRLTVRGIAAFVAQHFQIRFQDLLGPSRLARLSAPRHIAMYLAKEILRGSYPEIGRRLGGRDHTTVLYAHRKVAARCVAVSDFAHDVAHIEATLRARQFESVVQ